MFNKMADGITALCVITLFAAVVYNFLNANPERPFRERRSLIATASMAIFFVLLYCTIRFRWGVLPFEGAMIFRSAGLALMLFGAAFNVWGRLHLKANWADQVRIYNDQQLITTGPYRIVRHPLYASIIWMFYGASIAYLNPLATLETSLIFFPAMIHRSNLEERVLKETFGEIYARYQEQTGRFFPKSGRHAK